MTNRERVNAILNFKMPDDRLPMIEWHPGGIRLSLHGENRDVLPICSGMRWGEART